MGLEHGTERMYRKELQGATPPCKDCTTAHAKEVERWRKTTTKPRDRRAERVKRTIKDRALRRLADEHPERLRYLVEVETISYKING